MNKDNLKPVIGLKPFKKFCMTIGELPASYLETMTYYEMLIWFTKYLGETIIPTVNNNAECIEELQNLFIELKNYVDSYFENLDVQEEINNKLDEMVEDGTFDNIINNYFNPNFKIIVPKNFTNVDAGDITIIKAFDKNIVIDTHRSEAFSQVKDFLDRNGIETIDYLILTHYHDDHIGNVINLINENYITTDTFVYLPGYSPLIAQSEILQQYYTDINNALTSNDIPHEVPLEGQYLEIQDFKITFYNCQTSIYETMGVTNYNDCSTVCLCEYGSQKALFTGDLIEKPFKRFVDNQMFNYKIDIYKVEHHGNDINSTSIPFLQQIMPSLALHETTSYSISLGRCSRSSSLAFMMLNNIPIFSQYENNNDIKVNVYKDRFNVTQGKQNNSIGSQDCIQNKYYVDPSSENTIQNGTQLYPFVNLHQCLSKINKMPYCNNTIYLSAGTYEGLTNIRINNAYITFNGNNSHPENVVIKDLMYILNSNITFNGICFDIVNSNGVDCTFSNVFLNKCLITNSNNEISSNNGFIGLNSILTLRDSTIEYCANGVNLQYGLLTAIASTLRNCTSALRINRGTFSYESLTFSDNTNDMFNTNAIDLSNNIKKGTLLNTDTTSPTVNNTIVTTKNYRNFTTLLFTLGYINNGTWQTCVVNAWHNLQFGTGDQFVLNTSSGNIVLELTNNTTITVKSADAGTPDIRQVVGLNT